MIEIKNIFAVIDPTTDKQYALERAKRIAKVTGAKIHAYLCLSPTLENHDLEALQRVELERYEWWLEKILADSRTEGFNIASQLEWHDDWRNSLGEAAARAKCDLIVKSSRRRTVAERLMLTSSDLALLNTANCAVQLVSSKVTGDLHKVLIAIDTIREDEKYQEIFNTVVEFGRTVKNSHEKGELHAVYAYSDSDTFQHVTDIAKRVEVDTEFIHIAGGAPDEAITEVAKKIGADIIIVGLSTRSTLANRFFGNIVDQLLNSIDNDILVVIPKED